MFQACNAFRYFLMYSKLHALDSMVTSQKLILQANNAFMSFVLCSKPHAFTSVVTADTLTYCNPLLSKVNGEGIASTSEF
jgi:hypothetical protein